MGTAPKSDWIANLDGDGDLKEFLGAIVKEFQEMKAAAAETKRKADEVADSVDSIDQSVKLLKESWNKWGERLRNTKEILGTVVDAVEAVWDAVKEGAIDADMERTFAAGVDHALEKLEALRRGTRETVNDTTLERVALTLDKAQISAAEFGDVARLALGEANRSGRAFSDVLQSISNQLVAGEFGELKNMGVQGKTLKDVLVGIRQRADELEPPLDSARIRMEQFETAVQNSKSALLQSVATTREFRRETELLMQGASGPRAAETARLEAVRDELERAQRGGGVHGGLDTARVAELREELAALQEHVQSLEAQDRAARAAAESLETLRQQEELLLHIRESMPFALGGAVDKELEAVQVAREQAEAAEWAAAAVKGLAGAWDDTSKRVSDIVRRHNDAGLSGFWQLWFGVSNLIKEPPPPKRGKRTARPKPDADFDVAPVFGFEGAEASFLGRTSPGTLAGARTVMQDFSGPDVAGPTAAQAFGFEGSEADFLGGMSAATLAGSEEVAPDLLNTWSDSALEFADTWTEAATSVADASADMWAAIGDVAGSKKALDVQKAFTAASLAIMATDAGVRAAWNFAAMYEQAAAGNPVSAALHGLAGVKFTAVAIGKAAEAIGALQSIGSSSGGPGYGGGRGLADTAVDYARPQRVERAPEVNVYITGPALDSPQFRRVVVDAVRLGEREGLQTASWAEV